MKPEKTIAILQSNYIPWKGYFDLINSVDEFLIFDEAQFTRRDWRNRNKIVVNRKPVWLTIPVASKGQYDAPVSEMRVSAPDWAEKHWTAIRLAYGKAPFFGRYEAVLKPLYERTGGMESLSEINAMFLDALCGALDIATAIGSTDGVPRSADNPTGRLVEICVAHGATRYLSGPAARDYIDNAQFEAAGVSLHYADYAGYPVYPQASDNFEHGVSVVDALMHVGPAARTHLKSVTEKDGLFARA